MPNRKRKNIEVTLEPAPYNLAHPYEAAPERIHKDPRIPHQRRTSFWVVVNGERVGRVVMTEYEDKPGWYYVPEVIDLRDGKRVKTHAVADPQPRRTAAIEAILEAV